MTFRSLFCACAGLAGLLPGLGAAEPVLKPKVVVVALFEIGADAGDAPGELQSWVEREHLDRTITLPGAYHDVRANADGSIIALAAGTGNTNTAISLTALGCDPRFDLRESYWLVAGIAGVDPADASVGSAVWADYVVDGDLAHEIDAREIPADWDTGYVPLGKTRPYEQPRLAHEYAPGQWFKLDPGLVAWAYRLTRDTPLADSEPLQKKRAAYTGFPNAQRPPFVLIGANLAASTYWHGRLLDRWANDWVRYFTNGQANFVTTAMEDSAALRALESLTHAGRADLRRALVLRAASNYDQPWPGGTAAESMAGEKVGAYSAYLPALEADYRVGSRVVHALVAGWGRYEKNPSLTFRPMMRRHFLAVAVAFVAATVHAASAPAVDLLLIAADDASLQPLIRQLRQPLTETHAAWTLWLGQLAGKSVVLTRTEGDPLNAVAATTLAVHFHPPRLILGYGVARPHDPALHPGDVVVSDAFAAFDGIVSPTTAIGGGSHPLQWMQLPHALMTPGEKENYVVTFPAAPAAADLALTLRNPDGRVVRGVLGSANQVNREADRIAYLHQQWHTSTEDGESAHIAGCAELLGVPVIGVRVVDGTPAEAAAFALRFVEAWK